MHRHEFVHEFSAESPFCGAMVMRNGGGDTCGKLREDEVHIQQWTEGEKAVLRASIGWWSGWLVGAWEEPLSDEEATRLATESIEDYIDNCEPTR